MGGGLHLCIGMIDDNCSHSSIVFQIVFMDLTVQKYVFFATINQGCNLYPDSGCPSSDGRRHFKCQRTGFCYASKEEAASCEEADETKPPSRECLWGDSEKGWMCGDGRCIIKSQVKIKDK